MHLLVAQAEGHSALEKASWVITIIAFGLGVLQLLIYWFGRNFPLQVRAKGHATRMSEGQQIIRVVVEFRSRTRDTQTVREILLFDPRTWSGERSGPGGTGRTGPPPPARFSGLPCL
jgi:hypothetical protein